MSTPSPTAAAPDPGLPIAGWYPDPENAEHDRWWTGVGWSDARRPGPAGLPAGPARAPIGSLAIVGFVLAVSGIVFPVVLNSLAGGIVSTVAFRRAGGLTASGLRSGGRGLAFAGILIGFIGAFLLLLAWAVIIAVVVWLASVQQNVQFPDAPVI